MTRDTRAATIPKPVRIVAARVTMGQRLMTLWRSRELLVHMVRTELKVKYKGSVLGFLWSMLNPALTLVVYYIVFTKVIPSRIPDFALYLFAGLLAWNLLSTSIQDATATIVSNAGIVKKVAFPREILALSSVGAGIVFFALQTVVLVIALLGFRYQPAYAYLPVTLLAVVDLVVFASALSVFLSAVNVYLRDTQHLVAVVFIVWFWAVPIIYPYQRIASFLGHRGLLWLAFADPVLPVILGMQRGLYGQHFLPSSANPHATVAMLPTYGMGWYYAVLGSVLVVSTLLFLGALAFFGRIEGNFAEEL